LAQKRKARFISVLIHNFFESAFYINFRGRFKSGFGFVLRTEEFRDALVSDAGSGNFGLLGCPAVCRVVVTIGSYEGPSKKSESVEAR
jgi:hypothetical protein